MERFVSVAGRPVDARSWRRVALTAWLLAAKMWDDDCYESQVIVPLHKNSWPTRAHSPLHNSLDVRSHPHAHALRGCSRPRCGTMAATRVRRVRRHVRPLIPDRHHLHPRSDYFTPPIHTPTFTPYARPHAYSSDPPPSCTPIPYLHSTTHPLPTYLPTLRTSPQCSTSTSTTSTDSSRDSSRRSVTIWRSRRQSTQTPDTVNGCAGVR